MADMKLRSAVRMKNAANVGSMQMLNSLCHLPIGNRKE